MSSGGMVDGTQMSALEMFITSVAVPGVPLVSFPLIPVGCSRLRKLM